MKRERVMSAPRQHRESDSSRAGKRARQQARRTSEELHENEVELVMAPPLPLYNCVPSSAMYMLEYWTGGCKQTHAAHAFIAMRAALAQTLAAGSGPTTPRASQVANSPRWLPPMQMPPTSHCVHVLCCHCSLWRSSLRSRMVSTGVASDGR